MIGGTLSFIVCSASYQRRGHPLSSLFSLLSSLFKLISPGFCLWTRENKIILFIMPAMIILYNKVVRFDAL